MLFNRLHRYQHWLMFIIAILTMQNFVKIATPTKHVLFYWACCVSCIWNVWYHSCQSDYILAVSAVHLTPIVFKNTAKHIRNIDKGYTSGETKADLHFFRKFLVLIDTVLFHFHHIKLWPTRDNAVNYLMIMFKKNKKTYCYIFCQRLQVSWCKFC